MRRSPWTIATLRGYTSAERSRKRNGVSGACDTADMEDSISGGLRDGYVDALRELDQPARVAPLVVVPGEHLDLGAAGHEREARVEDRRVRGLDDVGRDQRILAVGEDAAELAFVGARADRIVDRLRRCLVLDLDGQVHQRGGRHGHADREALQAAGEL